MSFDANAADSLMAKRLAEELRRDERLKSEFMRRWMAAYEAKGNLRKQERLRPLCSIRIRGQGKVIHAWVNIGLPASDRTQDGLDSIQAVRTNVCHLDNGFERRGIR
jgi:hypothetical protein